MIHKRAWSSLFISEIEEEITIRLKLIDNMVGNLYPSILLDEVAQLGQLIADRRDRKYGPLA